MDQFINTKESLVTDAIDGALIAAGGRLARLDSFPHVKVVMRADWDKSKVALISGGGSGHEPAHAGFVGQGMLTAAICGDVFASPSVDAVLAGILAVTGEAGCLMIVKNYTGDRLNFGLAAERARALGLNVAMVIVDDDIALPDLPQQRGVAGTLFVHKIAGAAAEAGQDLATIEKVASSVIGSIASIGKSLDSCTIPGSGKEERIGAGMAELGLGIHGEPGIEQVRFDGARSAMTMVLDRLEAHMGKGQHVVLLNNLGSTMPLEMSVLAKEMATSNLAGRIGWMIGPAPMMTSLDMHGFSVSILPANDEWLAALDLPVDLAAWPGMVPLQPIAMQPLPQGLSPIEHEPSKDPNVAALLHKSCDLLIDAERALNLLDTKSGDGDTGSTLASAAHALKDSLDHMPLADTSDLLRAIGNKLSQTMGGSSGVILAIFFNASGEASSRGQNLVGALEAGLARISDVGGAKAGDRTLIDALQPALEALKSNIGAAADAARRGADATAKMGQAKAGRAAYVPEASLKGHNDPGAEAVALLFAGLAAFLDDA